MDTHTKQQTFTHTHTHTHTHPCMRTQTQTDKTQRREKGKHTPPPGTQSLRAQQRAASRVEILMKGVVYLEKTYH